MIDQLTDHDYLFKYKNIKLNKTAFLFWKIVEKLNLFVNRHDQYPN